MWTQIIDPHSVRLTAKSLQASLSFLRIGISFEKSSREIGVVLHNCTGSCNRDAGNFQRIVGSCCF